MFSPLNLYLYCILRYLVTSNTWHVQMAASNPDRLLENFKVKSRDMNKLTYPPPHSPTHRCRGTEDYTDPPIDEEARCDKSASHSRQRALPGPLWTCRQPISQSFQKAVAC